MESLPALIDDAINGVTKGDFDAIQCLLNVARQVSEVVVSADALESEAGPDAAPAEIATDAAGGFTVIVLLAVLFPLVMIAVVLAGAQKTIGGIAIVGGPVGGMLGFVVSWLRTLIRHAAGAIESDAKHMWSLIRAIFHLWLRIEGVALQSQVAHDASVEYNHFTKWINAVQTDVRNIGNDIYNDTSGLRHAVTAINHDLSYINSEMSKLWGVVNGLPAGSTGPSPAALKHLQAEIDATNAHVLHVQSEIGAINRTLYKIDASGHGVDTKIAEIETLQQRQAHEIAQLQAAPHTGHGLTAQQQHDLGYSNWAAHMLAPLIALAPFTASFLRNASSLRSCDPCQAALPGSGSALIDGIVADLVIKDGI